AGRAEAVYMRLNATMPLPCTSCWACSLPYVGRLASPIALDDGPDAVQEALIVIFNNTRQLREPAALFGWARAVTVREAVRGARRAARAQPADLADLPARGDPQLAVDVRDVLERLSADLRSVKVRGRRFLRPADERSGWLRCDGGLHPCADVRRTGVDQAVPVV